MTTDNVIENPILNGPFQEPKRHFKFSDDGITNEIVERRRHSSYFVPIPQAKKSSKQLSIDFDDWNKRLEENQLVNELRERVGRWRAGNYAGVTPTTKRLLEYWTDPQRENKLFFCQIEALETVVYVTEVAKKYGDGWIEAKLKDANDSSNPGLYRLAFKMATGTGKTVVMGMLIAWQALNKFANPQDNRYSDAFILIAPGLTIRDRLQVLLPHDPNNYYRQRDILPPELIQTLCKCTISIINFHAFLRREVTDASRLAKSILQNDESQRSGFTETADEMVRRVLRDFGNKKKSIVVINDEAHHCYQRKPEADDQSLSSEEKKEAEANNTEAKIWLAGIYAIKQKFGIKAIYDLSATPFFLKGSGWSEGTLFPWVISDFSLIDAIESGIVKVPRVPVSDNSMQGDQPAYRDLWIRIRDSLPKTSRKKEEYSGEPKLPVELESAIHSLYNNYRAAFSRYKQDSDAGIAGRTHPVFIVVCNNTNVSKLVYEYISGWEKALPNEQTVAVEGQLPIFSNVVNGRWSARPNTILVDSHQLESGEAMSTDFKKIASREIEEFKDDYKLRYPGRDETSVTDEEILREVMNTVGKVGKLGENVKCVVSVSMLTEGWDANSVTHILGVRAFSTQLLCEQVVGRGLRRMSYAINDHGKFEPEYAEVYGVPFSFIPSSGKTHDHKPGPIPTRVRALKNRFACEISFPRVVGYRYDFGDEKLSANFSKESILTLSTDSVPTRTEISPIVGRSSEHTLDEVRKKRDNEIVYQISKLILDQYFKDDDGSMSRPWLFPQVLEITKAWFSDFVVCKDDTFKQLVWLQDRRHEAARLIWNAIVAAPHAKKILKPILRPYDTFGTTANVDFDTVRPVLITKEDKCHISHVVADTNSWEQKMAESLEDMPEVKAYAKNYNLGFFIPYTLNGEERKYFPDFLVRYKDEKMEEEIQVILEVTGERLKEKVAKVAAATNFWIPAVNNSVVLGRWDFIEVHDPWNAKTLLRKHFSEKEVMQVAKSEGANRG